jgi:hypothetical protein
MLCPFKHWMIGGTIISRQTGHSRRFARLLLKSDFNFRLFELANFAAILYAVYNLLLYKIIIIIIIIIIITKERKRNLTSGVHRCSKKCRDHVQIFCVSER